MSVVSRPRLGAQRGDPGVRAQPRARRRQAPGRARCARALPPPATTTDGATTEAPVIAPAPRWAGGRRRPAPCTAAGSGSRSIRASRPWPVLAQRRDGLRLVPRRVGEHPEHEHGDHQRRASGGDQRQLQPGHRQQPDDVADVDGGLRDQPGGGGRHDELEPRVGVAGGDPEARVGQRGEQRQHRERADEAQLLADDREDEVVVGVGQVAPLGAALPQPDAEQPAVGERVERLLGLEPGLQRVGRCPGERNAVIRLSR